MTEKEEIQKTCKNCIHYIQHYIKRNNRCLEVAQCGFCEKKPLNYKRFEVCRLWEYNNLKEERKDSIKETLRKMSKRLDDIAMILKDDND